MPTEEGETGKSIVVFDGFCNFCSASVLFIIRRDPELFFRFAASQSENGQKLLKENSMNELAEHSIILISNGKIYKKSTAALRIARQLSGLWPVLYILFIVPVSFRDFIYDLFARNRYRIYGKKEVCFIPDPEIKQRFL